MPFYYELLASPPDTIDTARARRYVFENVPPPPTSYTTDLTSKTYIFPENVSTEWYRVRFQLTTLGVHIIVDLQVTIRVCYPSNLTPRVVTGVWRADQVSAWVGTRVSPHLVPERPGR